MLEVRRGHDRGYSDNGWLKTFHSFAFADYFDPEHIEFGPLRVINEARVKPGKTFGPDAQQDMEILTYMLQGELDRGNSLGESVILGPGDVQCVSAGTGVQLSGVNSSAGNEVHMLQIWVRPASKDLAPAANTRHFSIASKRGALKLIASPAGEVGSLTIQQDARVYATLLGDTQRVEFDVDKHRCAYVHVARGSVAVNDTRLNAGDAMKITQAMKVTQATRVTLQHGSNAEVIVLDLPAGELSAVFRRPRAEGEAVRRKGSGSSGDSDRRATRRTATSGK